MELRQRLDLRMEEANKLEELRKLKKKEIS